MKCVYCFARHSIVIPYRVALQHDFSSRINPQDPVKSGCVEPLLSLLDFVFERLHAVLL